MEKQPKVIVTQAQREAKIAQREASAACLITAIGIFAIASGIAVASAIAILAK